ncbi:MAG TPA: hypothetical protein VGK73_30205, partial [Polyangiaceae bacterium]
AGGGDEAGGEAGASGGAGTGASSGSSNGGNAGNGGNSGDSGAGGTGPGGAGSGGTGGAPLPSPVCDDGNPCTADAFVEGACRNDPVVDGSRCDDADFCSSGDRCEAGACLPTGRLRGESELLGQIDMYGTSGGYSGAPVAVYGRDRFVFFDSLINKTRVVVADVEDGSLRTRDKLELDLATLAPVSAAWDGLAATIDGDTSITIGGDGRMLQILSVAEDGVLSERGRLELDGSVMSSMVGRGNKLFLCSNFQFISPPATGTVSYLDVSDPDAPVLVSQTSVGSGASCGSIALSEDGDRLYVNTSGGVLFSDLANYSGSGPLEFAAEPLVPVESGVHLRGGRVLTRTGTGSEITVFDEASHEIEGRFTVTGANLAGLGEHGVFVQGVRPAGAGREFFAALYDFEGSLIEERLLGTTPYSAALGSQKPAISLNYAFAPSNASLFELTDEGLSDAFAPTLGNPGLLFVDSGGVHARSRLSSHRIDVSDPGAPALVAGGWHGGPLGLRLDVSLSPPALLPDLESTTLVGLYLGYTSPLIEQSATNYASQLRLPLVGADAGERLAPTGAVVDLPGGGAALLSAGDYLYRAELANGGLAVRFRRWLVADLVRGVTAPSLDLSIELPATTTNLSFDVDPVARVAVIAANLVLYRIDLTQASPVAEAIPLSNAIGTSVRRVRVAHNRVAYTDGSGIGFLDLDEKVEQVLPELPVTFIGSILGFDGTTAFLSSSFMLTAVQRGLPLEQAVVGQFPMNFVPTSLVESSGVLVAASLGGIITLAPFCD